MGDPGVLRSFSSSLLDSGGLRQEIGAALVKLCWGGACGGSEGGEEAAGVERKAGGGVLL